MIESHKPLNIVEKHVEVAFSPSTPIGKAVRERIFCLAIEHGFKSNKEFLSFLNEVYRCLASINLKRKFSEKELSIIKVQAAIEETEKILNLLISKIRDLYGVHFPELNSLVKSHMLYAKIIAKIGLRKNFSEERLKEVGVQNKGLSSKIMSLSRSSVGAEIDGGLMENIRKLAQSWLDLHTVLSGLKNKLEEDLMEVSPNLLRIAGLTVSAKLLSITGGLNRLAMLPSSKIQVLGAEKALYKHLKGKGKPPKHGVIFLHPLVRKAKKSDRGRISRVLANKIAIAARIDAFKGENMASDIEKSLKEKVSRITGGKNRNAWARKG